MTGSAGSHVVLLGLGANLGEPAAQLERAVELLREVLQPMVVSSVYRSAPVGYLDQPDFLNLACAGSTRLGPEELLAVVQEIELRLGRQRSFRNAPRRIDIDILAFGDLVLNSPGLVIPHPRLHTRRFVLAPLAEIAPDWRHPVLGRSPVELLKGLEALAPVERVMEV